MARTHRRKDLVAAMLIIGAALVYWMSRRSPEITFDDSDTPSKPRVRATTLPGLNRTE